MLVDIQKMNNKKILITGGGSGGHLSSANSIIDALIEDYAFPLTSIVYVGGDLGMEGEKPGNSLEQRQMVNKQYKTYFIRAGKLQRKISFHTLKLLSRTLLGFWDSFNIFLTEKPNIVVSTGGFVSVPVCFVAWIFNIPIFLHEQTASVGLSNKIIGKISKRIYISFKSSLKYFNQKKTLHVGNNVRKAIFKKECNSQEIKTLVEEKGALPFVYVSGGSLGSHVLNLKILKDLKLITEKYVLILQTGDNQEFRDYELALDMHSKLDEDKRKRFLPVKYIDQENIGYVLNNMDFFVGRSGANTVYEIGVLKKYALFVPIPWTTHNEQFLNAKVLEEVGTAKILEEKYLADANLVDELQKLEQQIKLRDINYGKLEELFPINANSKMIDDIFSYFK